MNNLLIFVINIILFLIQYWPLFIKDFLKTANCKNIRKLLKYLAIMSISNVWSIFSLTHGWSVNHGRL